MRPLLRTAVVAALAAWLMSTAEATVPAQTTRPSGDGGIWISREQLMGRPTSGASWESLKNAADQDCGTPELSNQDDPANVCVMAQALVFARTGAEPYRSRVVSALRAIAHSRGYSGRALALGRELAAYVIAADLIDLRGHDARLDSAFRATLRSLLTARTSGGPRGLVECHETRPNNWGTHCGASRAAVAAYLGDTAELARVATVFRGWLGDRSSHAGFSYGSLDWQCDPSTPVGINPLGCKRHGQSLDGVLPDDQRRGGAFVWPPFKESYVWEGLQGALAQATILERAGYQAFDWENRALLRAVRWLYDVNHFPAEGDDGWQVHLVNFFYGTSLAAPIPARPGKNAGWTDWSHGR